MCTFINEYSMFPIWILFIFYNTKLNQRIPYKHTMTTNYMLIIQTKSVYAKELNDIAYYSTPVNTSQY